MSDMPPTSRIESTMALEVDNILEFINIATCMQLEPETDYSVDDLCARGYCTPEDARATLHILRYLGEVERIEMPDGQTCYRVSP
jgi:hypothetical protein